MTRSPRLDDLLPYLMNRLVSRLNQNLGERLRRDGYSFQDWRILAVLAAHDGITLSQLAEATVIPQPTVSRLVASLARRGLLRRRVRTGDSRFVEARITPRGEDRLPQDAAARGRGLSQRGRRLRQGGSRRAQARDAADARQHRRGVVAP